MLPAPTEAADLKRVVREKYAAVVTDNASCCGPGCGCADPELVMIGDEYEGVAGYVAGADYGLGCGLPTEHAGIQAGDTVLDLGSGAGIDAFVARALVGETGRVLGVDMTPEMIAKARENADRLGYANVFFRLGEIEALPVETGSVDVVVSNCVLNLVPDKARAFAEMHRVIRPGGHFCVSDIVTHGALPEAVRRSAELYAGCVAGAMEEADYLAALEAAGFTDVRVVREKPIRLPEGVVRARTDGAADDAGALVSVTVYGVKRG